MLGYSVRTAEAIQKADVNLLGVKLGRACLARDISVSTVAEILGVTRQTVYSWFLGEREPRDEARSAIQNYLTNLG